MNSYKKMIFIDLDGTLLNSRSAVSKTNKKIIKKLIALNYAVIIATGRNYHEAAKLTKDIEGLAYITTNGSHIVDFDQSEIFNKPLNKKILISVINNLEQYQNLIYYITSPDEIIAKNKYKIFKNILFMEGFGKLFSLDGIIRLINNYKLISVTEKDDIINFLDQREMKVQKIYVMGREEELKKAKKIFVKTLMEG